MAVATPGKLRALPAVARVHETLEPIASVELSPPHPPRSETPEYVSAHHFLVYEKKAECEVCGVNIDTLHDPQANPFGAKAMETHHHPVERSLADACDPVKVHRDYPQVYNRATLMQFVDSPANLKVLCDIHHRSLQHGIHHLTPADYAVQRYLYDGYVVAAAPKDAAAALATDERIEQAQGIEQEVDAELGLTDTGTPTEALDAAPPAEAAPTASQESAAPAPAPTPAVAPKAPRSKKATTPRRRAPRKKVAKTPPATPAPAAPAPAVTHARPAPKPSVPKRKRSSGTSTTKAVAA